MGKHRPKIGYIAGAFDFVHAGHCLAFEEAKKQCDYLIAGLNVNPHIGNLDKNKPIMSMEERYIMLKANKFIDAIIVFADEYESKLLDTWLPYDVRFIGEDHKNDDWSYIKKPIIFLSRKHNYSSGNLRKRVLEAEK